MNYPSSFYIIVYYLDKSCVIVIINYYDIINIIISIIKTSESQTTRTKGMMHLSFVSIDMSYKFIVDITVYYMDSFVLIICMHYYFYSFLTSCNVDSFLHRSIIN